MFETKARFENKVLKKRGSNIVIDHFSDAKLDLLLGDDNKLSIDGILLLDAHLLPQ